MALIGAINTASSQIGEGLTLIDSLFQKQITVRDAENINDIVLLNVVSEQELDFVVEITEKPVADLGGAVDYISRTSSPLTLTGIISNRNIDLLQDPVEFVLQHAGAFIPELLNVINQSSSMMGQFWDLGKDEIDKKIATLLRWQNDAVPVEVLGLRLDAKKFSSRVEQFKFFIERITPNVSQETGDNVALTIVFKNLLNVTKAAIGFNQGARLSESKTGVIDSSVNQFAGA